MTGQASSKASQRIHLLFVCLGNICRSPTAQGVIGRQLYDAGLADHVRVDSAGTAGYHVGEAPDSRAQAAARARGVDISHLRARPVQRSDFHEFDHILAMDRANLATLNSRQPRPARARIGLLMEYAPKGYDLEIADPYAGGPEGFERILDQIEAAGNGLIQALCTRHGLRCRN